MCESKNAKISNEGNVEKCDNWRRTTLLNSIAKILTCVLNANTKQK